MPPLNEDESLALTTTCSSLMDDVEDAALRLLPFLADNKEILGEMALSARLIASRAFAINGALIARHYRRFRSVIQKSRSESDVPVKPTENFVTALELASSIVDAVLKVSSELEAIYEEPEEALGGAAAKTIAESYEEGVATQVEAVLQLATAIQHGLVLVNAGFDFDGITAAIKVPDEESGQGDSRRYI